MEEKKIYKDPFLVVLEGADATGKHTQSRRLFQSFETGCPRNGPMPYIASFPVYESPSSYFVKNYLNNAYDHIYQDNKPINVRLICDFYAMDHFDRWFNRNVPDNDHYTFDQAYQDCHPIILDRSWISNMIHQPILLFTRVLHKDTDSHTDIEQLIVNAFEYSIHNNFYNMKTFVKLPYSKFTRLDLSEILLRYKSKLKVDNPDINFDTNYIIGSFYNSLRVLVLGYLVETNFEKMRLPVPDRIINLGFRDYSLGRQLLENRNNKKDKYETNYAYLALINYLSPFIFNYLSTLSYFSNCKIYQVYCDRLDLETKQFTIATIDEVTHAIIDALHHKETKK